MRQERLCQAQLSHCFRSHLALRVSYVSPYANYQCHALSFSKSTRGARDEYEQLNEFDVAESLAQALGRQVGQPIGTVDSGRSDLSTFQQLQPDISSIKEIKPVGIEWSFISDVMLALTQGWKAMIPDSLAKIVLGANLNLGRNSDHSIDYEGKSDECLDFLRFHRGPNAQLNYLKVNECIVGTYQCVYERLGVQVVPEACVDLDAIDVHEDDDEEYEEYG